MAKRKSPAKQLDDADPDTLGPSFAPGSRGIPNIDAGDPDFVAVVRVDDALAALLEIRDLADWQALTLATREEIQHRVCQIHSLANNAVHGLEVTEAFGVKRLDEVTHADLAGGPSAIATDDPVAAGDDAQRSERADRSLDQRGDGVGGDAAALGT